MEYAYADALNKALRMIGIRHRALADALLAELGLHAGQEMLLLTLDERGPLFQTQIAVALNCEPPSVTGMARKLEDAGLVIRYPSPKDSRATMVELSEKGRSLMPKLKMVWQRLAEVTAAGVKTPPDQLLAVAQDVARRLVALSEDAEEKRLDATRQGSGLAQGE